MARKTFIAGNWKMNKTAAETKALAEALKESLAQFGDTVTMAVCPTFTSLATAVEVLKGSNVKVGAQNIHWADNGAFTGEIFGETDETVNKRIKAALKYELKPIVCIGETLEEREGNKTNNVLAVQLKGGLADLTAADMANITLAYEPVWAIGTGKTATPEMAQETHAFIRKTLTEMFGAEVAENTVVQYGGSMKAENAADLTAQKDIDGGLIGGAALKADSFTALIANAQK